jgi:hypothetical protein
MLRNEERKEKKEKKKGIVKQNRIKEEGSCLGVD